MRHQKANRKLNRTADQRKALFRNLVTSLILHEKIETTEAKAKEIKPIVDRIFSMVQKNEPVIAIRKMNAYLFDKAASRKMIEVLKDRYKDRSSGFTRIQKVRIRPGDAATIVNIELV